MVDAMSVPLGGLVFVARVLRATSTACLEKSTPIIVSAFSVWSH